MSRLERSSSHTKGATMRDSQRMGRATITAIGSGERSAICFGTISPITSETNVVITITNTKPTVCAVSAGRPAS